MKKFSLFLVLVLLLSVFSAFAEGIDLSGMSLDELVDLVKNAQMEVLSRNGLDNNILYQGSYIVGEDIAEGEYIFTCIRLLSDDFSYGWIYVYENEETVIEDYIRQGESYRVKVTNGDVIELDQAVFSYVKR